VWHVSGPSDWLEARDRITGWRQSLEEVGAPVPPIIAGDWSARSGYAAGTALAGNPDVTAVFVANDQMALGLLRALHERGVRVPADISVVAFDDIPEAEFMLPPLTTVRQDFDEVGRRGMATLLRLLGSTGHGARPAAVLPTAVMATTTPIEPTLVVRQSTAAPAGG
jgi:LacI family transcriptional regulator